MLSVLSKVESECPEKELKIKNDYFDHREMNDFFFPSNCLSSTCVEKKKYSHVLKLFMYYMYSCITLFTSELIY